MLWDAHSNEVKQHTEELSGINVNNAKTIANSATETAAEVNK